MNVGRSNIEFVRKFLATENIPLVAERLGGECCMLVHFITDTAQAFIKLVGASDAVLGQETTYARKAAKSADHPPRNNVTLF